jgi:toxin-antitoxin system PIN domain toxin
MQFPDVNVLIYAHREDAPEHERYAAWLRALTTSDEPFALSDFVLSGFLRIVTNQRIFDPATPMDTALAFCQRLVDWPRGSLITPGRRHWELFTGLCRHITGSLVTDAYIAALAIEHGCELITTDSDFARFQGLRWRHPLAAM